MQPAIIQQYEYTYKMIHSESSNNNEIQEEILKISKKKVKFFTVFLLIDESPHNDVYFYLFILYLKLTNLQCFNLFFILS